MKRRVEGRNVEDSDADLYAEYHGKDSAIGDDLESLDCHDNSSGVRHRVTFSCQSENERDRYELHPDLSSTIETNFTSMHHKKMEDKGKVASGQGQDQNSNDANTSKKETDCDTRQTNASEGYDFRTKFEELYREQRHIVEDSRIREEERRRSKEKHNITESLINRSKSWSEGRYFQHTTSNTIEY